MGSEAAKEMLEMNKTEEAIKSYCVLNSGEESL